jgi:hypothetical protein
MSISNTRANSIDNDSNNDKETDSISSLNDFEQNEKCLFELFHEILINPTEEKIKQVSLKIFSNNNNLAEENHISNRYSPFFVTKKKKNRGRETKNMNKPKHLSTEFDNLQRKIQVHFFTFIVNLSNDAIKAVLGSKTPYNFKQIDYKIKILTSHHNVINLHKLLIKDVLEMKISPRNKNYSEFINKETLNIVCHLSKPLKDFFDIKYLEFFNDFYFNKEKEAYKVIFKEYEIPFSKKTKNFYQLLKKYENEKTLLINSAKRVYFNGYDALIRSNSFIIFKKDTKLNEENNLIIVINNDDYFN